MVHMFLIPPHHYINMTDVDDVQNYENTYNRQLEKLEAAEIVDSDREAIRDYVRHADARGEIKTGTIIRHLNCLRLSAERGTAISGDVE